MTKNFSCFACFSVRVEVARSPLSDGIRMLVLESSPYPSYYSRAGFPENLRTVGDHHLYLVVRKSIPCFQDRVMRMAHQLRERTGTMLHISPGQITLWNKTWSCIRIRTDDVAVLPEYIKGFRSLGIRFLRDRHVEPYHAFVQYKRYTEFVIMEPGIYRDSENPHLYFVTLPANLEYPRFEELIKEVKNNCDFHMFDASLIYLNCGTRFIDMVGVYSEHCEEERLGEMKRFLEEKSGIFSE